jgi:hypothetical protein
MREYSKEKRFQLEKLNKVEARKVLARLRQDQLDAALAGRMDESAFFAGEARAFRLEIAEAGGSNCKCASRDR